VTDAELVARLLASLETYVHELRKLAHPERMAEDVREERFILHTLQLAAQTALDVASHIVSDERLGEPRNNAELFQLLAQDGWIPDHLAEPLGNMAKFRNILVHGYALVDLAIVRDVVENHLDDLLDFTRFLRGRLEAD
jgi:uncharacterized protein YutE (UPF0331/DUF86 family)